MIKCALPSVVTQKLQLWQNYSIPLRTTFLTPIKFSQGLENFRSANVEQASEVGVGINFTAILNKLFPRFTIVIVNMRNC